MTTSSVSTLARLDKVDLPDRRRGPHIVPRSNQDGPTPHPGAAGAGGIPRRASIVLA
ncbi:UNVERIFIED_CONTAM: hypothetical protein RF648_12225 [Kocuria sp. CPCC 205274]